METARKLHSFNWLWFITSLLIGLLLLIIIPPLELLFVALFGVIVIVGMASKTLRAKTGSIYRNVAVLGGLGVSAILYLALAWSHH